MKLPKLYGARNAYEFLGISRQRFSQLVAEKKIPYQKISIGKVFCEPDLIKFKNKQIMRAKTDKRIRVKK